MMKILMIDDHPTQLEGYKTILSYNTSDIELDVTMAYNCEAAYHLIVSKEAPPEFDIVFLDWSLPPYPEQHIKTGEDLAILVKEHLPQAKTIMLTSHSEAFLLYNIVKNTAPTGLLVKSDFTADELILAFDTIANGGSYHSQTVKESIKLLLSRDGYLDAHNRQIILLLSQGIKTKNLSDHINLSRSAIEKRKVQIKDYFSIKDGGDEEIITEARRLGFI